MSPQNKWQCSECTFENSVESVECEICQGARSLVSTTSVTMSSSVTTIVGTVSSPGFRERGIRGIPHGLSSSSTTNTIGRHQSELMDDLRRIEEHEALQQWQRIVCYCTEVLSFFGSLLTMHRRFLVVLTNLSVCQQCLVWSK